jgi:hypothetical protein
MLARHLDGLMMLLVGVWIACVGFGWLPLASEGKPPFVATFKRHARWMGPLLVLIAVTLMLAGQA